MGNYLLSISYIFLSFTFTYFCKIHFIRERRIISNYTAMNFIFNRIFNQPHALKTESEGLYIILVVINGNYYGFNS